MSEAVATDPKRGYVYAHKPTDRASNHPTPHLGLHQARNEPQTILIRRRPTLNNALRKNPTAAIGMRRAWDNAVARAVTTDKLWRMATPVRITATPLYPDHETPPDTDACTQAVTMAINALATAGIIPDDTPTHVAQVVLNRPLPDEAPGLRIDIEHLP